MNDLLTESNDRDGKYHILLEAKDIHNTGTTVLLAVQKYPKTNKNRVEYVN